MSTQIVVTESLVLTTTKAPALPVAPVEYSRQYQDQLSNILRLYFNTLDNFVAQLQANGTSASLQFPNGAFHQDGYTTLSTTIPNGVSTADIQVASTATFQSAGTLLIGKEFIKYTGKTATTFTGITRGMYGSTKSSHTAGVYVSEAQAVPNATTSLALVMTGVDVSKDVSLDPLDTSKIVFDIPGYYNIQFSIQLASFDGTIDDVSVWFAYNTNPIANSAGVITVPGTHGGDAGSTIAGWNIVYPVNAGDTIQIYMSSVTGNTLAVTYPPGSSPTRPASPSVIVTATFVSAL